MRSSIVKRTFERAKESACERAGASGSKRGAEIANNACVYPIKPSKEGHLRRDRRGAVSRAATESIDVYVCGETLKSALSAEERRLTD